MALTDAILPYKSDDSVVVRIVSINFFTRENHEDRLRYIPLPIGLKEAALPRFDGQTVGECRRLASSATGKRWIKRFCQKNRGFPR
jgi:hypothetical protein